jgi:hypothetical protein
MESYSSAESSSECLGATLELIFRQTEYGPEFLTAWEIFNLVMIAYGLIHLLSPAGKSIVDALFGRGDELLANNRRAGFFDPLTRV